MLARQTNGSILIEAILSVVIFAVGIVMIVQAMATATTGIQRSSEYSTAMMLADNVMFDYLQEGVDSPVFQKEEAFEKPFEQFTFKVDGSGLTAASYEEGSVSQIQMEVRKAADQKILSLTTFLPVHKKDEN